MQSLLERHARIICLEGPSAVGKTTLADRLARTAGAAIVPEPSTGRPPGADPAVWYVARHVDAWAHARDLSTHAPLVVLDGDPFKGLWYNWVYAADAASDVAELYASAMSRGTLAFPDLYVILGATGAQLRQRRAEDSTRSRRNFETHLKLIGPQRRYFAALDHALPGRVLWLDTSERSDLVDAVLTAVDDLPPIPPESEQLLGHMTEWLRMNPLPEKTV